MKEPDLLPNEEIVKTCSNGSNVYRVTFKCNGKFRHFRVYCSGIEKAIEICAGKYYKDINDRMIKVELLGTIVQNPDFQPI